MSTAHDEEDNLDHLYRDVLLEHYRRPHHKGELPGAEIVTKGNNPVCGDRITVYGKLNASRERIEQLYFDGKGCAICIASSSMMTEALRGKSLDEAARHADRVKKMMRNELPFEVPPELADFEALEGVKKFPVRVKCATLAWTTLQNGILAYQAGKLAEETTTEKE